MDDIIIIMIAYIEKLFACTIINQTPRYAIFSMDTYIQWLPLQNGGMMSVYRYAFDENYFAWKGQMRGHMGASLCSITSYILGS